MNYDEALKHCKTLDPKALEVKLAGAKARIETAVVKAKVPLDLAREKQKEGKAILAEAEEDRILAHAIIAVQKERKTK